MSTSNAQTKSHKQKGDATEPNVQAGAHAPRELLFLPLAMIVPSNTNPRLNLEKEPFNELKKSLLQNGLLQPIVVRPMGDAYEIVGGHRRFYATKELAREHPGDLRFERLAAVVRDVDDTLMPVLQLAENLNRSDLSPLEISDGIARALDVGVTPEQLAEQLGWTRRNLARYQQLHSAPAWLKDLAKEVKVTKKKLDASGSTVLDPKTGKSMTETERYPALPFTYVVELVTLHNVLHEADKLELEEQGGDGFKPQAERVTKKLAQLAAVEGWSTRKLREEIKKAKDPERKEPSARTDAPPFSITETKVIIDLKRADEFDAAACAELGVRLTKALQVLPFKNVIISV